MSARHRATQLPKLLSLLPKDGVGSRVYQNRWRGQGYPVPTSLNPDDAQGKCYWEVVKSDLRINENGKPRGDAWGVKYWKGQRVTPADVEAQPISGGLKYLWQAASPPLALRVNEQRPAPPAEPTPTDEPQA
ncbi:hypothetical protein JCM10212_002165 [Sporobolomyces blumeae]